VRLGLAATSGNHRAMQTMFGIDPRDYKRFLNFLTTHDCSVDFRQFRSGSRRQGETVPAVPLLPRLAPVSPEPNRHLH
jgi:hypothetical protein